MRQGSRVTIEGCVSAVASDPASSLLRGPPAVRREPPGPARSRAYCAPAAITSPFTVNSTRRPAFLRGGGLFRLDERQTHEIFIRPLRCPLICPVQLLKQKMVRPRGFEPLAYGFVVRCSIQLSYGRVRNNCAQMQMHLCTVNALCRSITWKRRQPALGRSLHAGTDGCQAACEKSQLFQISLPFSRTAT